MIFEIIRKWLSIEATDQRVKELKGQADETITDAVLVLKQQGKMQQKLVKKTTTFYIAQAMGVI